MNPADNHPENIFLSLQDVTFVRFNGPPLQNISWIIRDHEIWAITGPVGAGKTTLAEALAGRLRVQEGKFLFKGNPLDYEDFQKQVAYISFIPKSKELNYAKFYYQQRYNSSDTINIITVEQFLSQTTGIKPPDNLWENIISNLNLENLLSLEVIKLSNGQTHKMLIAQALLRKPQLLLLDNPFTGLDTQTRIDFTQRLRNLFWQGTHVVLVLNPTEIPAIVTHVLELDHFQVKNKCTYQEYKVLPQALNLPEPELHMPEEKSDLFLSKQYPVFQIGFQFSDTSIRYDGKIILDKINWTVLKGEKWALLGPNGSGKTTLLSLINGDNPQAFANKIILFDRRKGSGESIWDIKKRVGFVSPELHLYFRQNLSAEKVAGTGFFDTLFLQRPLTAPEQEQLQNLFSYYGYNHLREKSFLQLSAGEQRVILLIRSLVKNPPVLIWDEPYQGLSESLIQKTQMLLTAFATPEKTIIFVSHYEQEIPSWINKRIYLAEGKIAKIIG